MQGTSRSTVVSPANGGTTSVARVHRQRPQRRRPSRARRAEELEQPVVRARVVAAAGARRSAPGRRAGPSAPGASPRVDAQREAQRRHGRRRCSTLDAPATVERRRCSGLDDLTRPATGSASHGSIGSRACGVDAGGALRGRRPVAACGRHATRSCPARCPRLMPLTCDGRRPACRTSAACTGLSFHRRLLLAPGRGRRRSAAISSHTSAPPVKPRQRVRISPTSA